VQLFEIRLKILSIPNHKFRLIVTKKLDELVINEASQDNPENKSQATT
jgi:hypothetical protein